MGLNRFQAMAYAKITWNNDIKIQIWLGYAICITSKVNTYVSQWYSIIQDSNAHPHLVALIDCSKSLWTIDWPIRITFIVLWCQYLWVSCNLLLLPQHIIEKEIKKVMTALANHTAIRLWSSSQKHKYVPFMHYYISSVNWPSYHALHNTQGIMRTIPSPAPVPNRWIKKYGSQFNISYFNCFSV